MRIALATDAWYPQVNGVVRTLSATVAELDRRGHEVELITPQRSEGGHRRYSRYQLRLAARARELVDNGTSLEAACRIIILEDQLAEALRINAELSASAEDS